MAASITRRQALLGMGAATAIPALPRDSAARTREVAARESESLSRREPGPLVLFSYHSAYYDYACSSDCQRDCACGTVAVDRSGADADSKDLGYYPYYRLLAESPPKSIEPISISILPSLAALAEVCDAHLPKGLDYLRRLRNLGGCRLVVSVVPMNPAGDKSRENIEMLEAIRDLSDFLVHMRPSFQPTWMERDYYKNVRFYLRDVEYLAQTVVDGMASSKFVLGRRKLLSMHRISRVGAHG